MGPTAGEVERLGRMALDGTCCITAWAARQGFVGLCVLKSQGDERESMLLDDIGLDGDVWQPNRTVGLQIGKCIAKARRLSLTTCSFSACMPCYSFVDVH